jgi:hypothetical protein
MMLSFHLFALAQASDTHEYDLTPTTKKYYSNTEFDSLLKETVAVLFKENHIPVALFEKNIQPYNPS